MRRLLITGTNSGCGKTTVTCAILAAFAARGLQPAAFKCGPDYIDPMFHRAALGVPAYSLDPYFLGAEGLVSQLAAHAGPLAVMEGAMGYYDGIAATDEASAYTVAGATAAPAVLVVSARGAGASLGAVLEGFLRRRPDSGIAGVIFNDAGRGRYADLEKIAREAGLRAYGCLRRAEAWSLPGRRLGLLSADEIVGLRGILSELGREAEETIDLDGLLLLAGTALPLPKPAARARIAPRVRLAVARDEAFCFLYEENLELLRALGCEPAFFSPMRDGTLPEGICGLYLPGGYPELHLERLAANAPMLAAVRGAVNGGLPTVAEGGGFLYLHETLAGVPMCRVIPGRGYETEKLARFGYIELTARRDSLLCGAGETIRSHAFHYWDSENPGDGFTARKAGRALEYRCVHATETLYAGFPQLYFPANPLFAEKFVERMTYFAR